ncbi:thymidylate synthase [Roseobacter phage RD-1410Ws-07]|uniref:Thymidylate synthase n=1 Tax=Roseobacter phage RD-1410Ws-07 TaxID=1815985 RepID=A0A191VYP4_9CAUD|nr:thymidylate synthase [Roseobacter phage RD-1410Ws-07]
MTEYQERRPRLLILGYARHGKDTVAEILRDLYGLNFMSSSEFVGRECLWDQWGKAVYSSFEEMFEDRVNNRELWMQMISAYNTPDKTRTASTMFERGYDMYVGMRRQDELDACRAAGTFDLVIWVDGSDRHPPETGSMDITQASAQPNYIVDNNGSLEDLYQAVAELHHHITVNCGFHWRLADELPVPEIKTNDLEEVDLLERPDESTPVLDHGYVALVDTMGSDAAIAEAARLSYGRGTRSVRSPEGLINYLYSHHHTSPFEMAEMKFQMRLPIFVMRQWVRHRTANLNEYSGRYSVMPRLWYVPETKDIKHQDTVNKQGSSGEFDFAEATAIQSMIDRASERAFDDYEELLSRGVSREMARIILPLNMYTEIVWKMDLNNMLKFLWLRDDGHAQPEIQAYAQVIAGYVEQAFPMTYAAYKKARQAVTLTYPELYAILTGDRSALSKSETAKSEALQRDLQQWIRAQLPTD